MGHLYELAERKNHMKEINQHLQKITTLTPYHLGELIDTVEQVETALQGSDTTKYKDIINYLEQIKTQADIIRRAREIYGTTDLVAALRLEIAQNQLQKLL